MVSGVTMVAIRESCQRWPRPAGFRLSCVVLVVSPAAQLLALVLGDGCEHLGSRLPQVLAAPATADAAGNRESASLVGAGSRGRPLISVGPPRCVPTSARLRPQPSGRSGDEAKPPGSGGSTQPPTRATCSPPPHDRAKATPRFTRVSSPGPVKTAEDAASREGAGVDQARCGVGVVGLRAARSGRS